jgi:hypothetical protein
MPMTCPACGSERTRRGGNAVWSVYLVLIALAVLGVVQFHLNAGLVAGVVLAAILLAHLIFDQRVCLDCGHQWSGRRPR